MLNLTSKTTINTTLKSKPTKAHKLLTDFLNLKLSERDKYLKQLYSKTFKHPFEYPTPKTYDRYYLYVTNSSKEDTAATRRESEIESFTSGKLAQTRSKTVYPWISIHTKERNTEFAKTMKEPRMNQLELKTGSEQVLDEKGLSMENNTEDNKVQKYHKKAQGMLVKLKTYMEKHEIFEQSLNQFNKKNQFMTETQCQEFSLQYYILRKQIEIFHDNYIQVFDRESVTYLKIIRIYLITIGICAIKKFLHKKVSLMLVW